MEVREPCGLAHDRQIVTIPCPDDLGVQKYLRLHDERQDVILRGQGNDREKCIYLELALAPWQQLSLRCEVTGEDDPLFHGGINHVSNSTLNNGCLVLPLWLGAESLTRESVVRLPVPLRENMAGRSCYLDSGLLPLVHRGKMVVDGPLRSVYEYEVRFEEQHSYRVRYVVDAQTLFVRMEEWFDLDTGAQIVWDFEGDSLPDRFYRLDTSPGYAAEPLFYHMDRRLARIAGWSQQCQLMLTDGYAVGFGNGEVMGFFAMDGGEWNGEQFNYLDAWVRRWDLHDRRSRRLLPPHAKADGFPSPERIPLRGESRFMPHFNVEGWVGGRGSRLIGVLVCERDVFERLSERGQSLLRRYHIQRGVYPLQRMVRDVFEWEDELFAAESPGLSHVRTLVAERCMKARGKD
ncbi:MAG: hypothetical protein D6820_09390, partial [Lentisphaerae bacterium]